MAKVKVLVRTLTGTEWWEVPHGLGRCYRSCAEHYLANTQGLCDLLSLVGYFVAPIVVAGWPFRKRIDAAVWAYQSHLRASDNHVKVPPRPAWMPPPGNGPQQGDGIWASSPTVLT
jgi:hypothetical protein